MRDVTPAEEEAIEARILSAVQRCKDAGIEIVTGTWGVAPADGAFRVDSNRPCACPLGAVLYVENCPEIRDDESGSDDVYEDSLTNVLAVPASWVEGFIDGVDGNDGIRTHLRGTAYAMGERVRKKLGLRTVAETA